MPLPAAEPGLQRVLLRDRAYRRLEAAIVDGTLQPGERLRDSELSKSLGISRTPIREALARLGEAGLVETAANRYTRVAPVAVAQASAGFAIAAALHALVAELAVARLTAADLDALREESERFTWAVWRRDVQPAAAADEQFHAILAVGAGHGQLERLLEVVMPALRRLERLAWPTLGERPGTRQHEALLAAADVRDGSAAAASGRDEWRALGQAVEQALADQRTSEFA